MGFITPLDKRDSLEAGGEGEKNKHNTNKKVSLFFLKWHHNRHTAGLPLWPPAVPFLLTAITHSLRLPQTLTFIHATSRASISFHTKRSTRTVTQACMWLHNHCNTKKLKQHQQAEGGPALHWDTLENYNSLELTLGWTLMGTFASLHEGVNAPAKYPHVLHWLHCALSLSLCSVLAHGGDARRSFLSTHCIPFGFYSRYCKNINIQHPKTLPL